MEPIWIDKRKPDEVAGIIREHVDPFGKRS